MTKPQQPTLFDLPPAWAGEWKGMPSFAHEDQQSDSRLIVHFRSAEDRHAFLERIGQPHVNGKRLSIWYPEQKYEMFRDKRCASSAVERNPRHPVYVISKGRWESRKTAKALDRIGVPFRIVVEPQELEAYAAVIGAERVLVTPFADLGQGSIPVRNFVWEHALSEGASHHWILDDNIDGFYRFDQNRKCPVGDGMIFRAAESFVDRYENVAISGFQYESFVPRRQADAPPFRLNTRIYSCILIRNDIPYRWRGRYNEDTDLSIRALKDGWCTVLFQAFLANKVATMRMTGGNSDELYRGNGRLLMAESLRDQHPDIVTITTKWGRPQHHVNYRGFRQRLRLRPGVEVPEGVDDFGMVFQLPEDTAR